MTRTRIGTRPFAATAALLTALSLGACAEDDDDVDIEGPVDETTTEIVPDDGTETEMETETETVTPEEDAS